MKPLVTIITPTYNRGASYLRETIDSVLSQDYKNIEYIVLDDGSTDNTQDLLASYENPRLKWESHPNMGETATVNKGFRMARGEFVMVLSSDDKYMPGLISKSVATMLENPEVMVTYPDWISIDPESQPQDTFITSDYSFVDMVRWCKCIPGPGSMIRRQVIDHELGRDPSVKYVGDMEFWLRAGMHGPFQRIPEVLAAFRIHPESASVAVRSRRQAEEHIYMYRKFFARVDLPDEIRAVKNEANAAMYCVAGFQCRDGDRALAGRLFLRSLLTSPLRCEPVGRPRDMGMILDYVPAAILPDWFRRPFGKIKMWLRAQRKRS